MLNPPRVGMMATLRNRRALVASVEAFDSSPAGRQHLVRVEYTDAEGVGEESILWECETGASLTEPNALPSILDDAPMPSRDFDALLRASRWSATTPFLSGSNPDATEVLPIVAPVYGAVQIEDFQLVPLLSALRMPRVSLLLADDVGLGKTIEAGLVLTELLVRRRLRRILVLCPASLSRQWRQEMLEKFALEFDIVDRPETHALQKRLGLDANPWRVYPRIIASYHYLRQYDILEQLLSTCRATDESGGPSANLPWDLLIVDEAHNLMPSNFGEDSDLCRMLRQISPYFEHKLFLTATPHNGHTRSFSGLLEQLDPVRFTQTSELKPEEKKRVEEIVVRRLKREINDLDDKLGRPRRFATRHPKPLPLYFSREERTLAATVGGFLKAVRTAIASSSRSGRKAGTFAVEILNKRLLSCPWTFAESWHRFRAGVKASEEMDEAAVRAAIRASEEEIEDDLEKEDRTRHAVHTVGAWMRPFLDDLAGEIGAVDAALERLKLHPTGPAYSWPNQDARFDRLVELIEEQLRTDKQWRSEERLIVFTEYKTTLDYLETRLKQKYGDDGEAIRTLYGQMDQRSRDTIKLAFNDPDDPVRVLIATDAASEGLNLQETARLLLHYEIPWNPSRLEQRNGRLDRHGQARDVFVHHFTSEDDADLKFIAHVVRKVEEIREDLGSMGEVFDAAFERRFLDQEDAETVQESLDHDIEIARGHAELPQERPLEERVGVAEIEKLTALRRDLDLGPETLRDTLEVALGIGAGLPRLEGPDARGKMKLVHPLPDRWRALIDDTLRLPSRDSSRGPIPSVVFDPAHFIERVNNRPVFRPSKDTVLLHLGHPLFRQALATFARARFPGSQKEFGATRWTVRYGQVPPGADAFILLSVEELAVNELREPFHHWVRTIRIPVSGGHLGEPLPYVPPADDRAADRLPSEESVKTARGVWLDIGPDVQDLIRSLPAKLTENVRSRLEEMKDQALTDEKERFRHRLQEVRRAMSETTIARLEKERDKLLADLRQRKLFEPDARDKETELQNLEDELERRRTRYQDLIQQLETEQTRVIEKMIPQRYQLRDQVQVFPVVVEIRLPEAVN